jgi:hypothetical protein
MAKSLSLHQTKLEVPSRYGNGLTVLRAIPTNHAVVSLFLFLMCNKTNFNVYNFKGFLKLPEKFMSVESVRFNRNEDEASMFVVTCKSGIVFGQWVGIIFFYHNS